MPNLSSRSGKEIFIFVSNLPDLTSALSSNYSRLVAAITTILEDSENPSISVKS